MTTLLEFVCERLIGEPTARRGNGESQWNCPQCNHSRFHTLPHKPHFRDRFNCFRCGFRGDVFDLLQEFFPGENFGDRKARLHELRLEYEAAGCAEPPAYTTGEAGSTHAERMAAAMIAVFTLINEEPATWTAGSRELDVLRSFVFFAEIASEYGVALEALAGEVAKYLIQQKAEVVAGNGRLHV